MGHPQLFEGSDRHGETNVTALMGTAELAGVNYFFKVSILAESTLLTAADTAIL